MTTRKSVKLSVETPKSEVKSGLKTSEFWATGTVVGVPLVASLGYFDKEPLTELGEMAAWFSAAFVASAYIFCRSWLKKTEIAHTGKHDENDM